VSSVGASRLVEIHHHRLTLFVIRNRQHHRRMVARANVLQHGAIRGAPGNRFGGKEIVEPPADVALAQVSPGCPPGEQIRVLRIDLRV
jgi:hypothetical protein